MKDRPYMTVRATGERIYLDDRRPARVFPPGPPPPPPAPTIYVECVLCGHPELQVEWARRPAPLICFGCAAFPRSIDVYDYRDRDFVACARGALEALVQEIGDARQRS